MGEFTTTIEAPVAPPPAAFISEQDASTSPIEHEMLDQGFRPRRRSSAGEPTSSLLPRVATTKVIPRDSLSFSSAGGANGVTTPRASGGLRESSDSLQTELQARAANYEAVMRYLSLRGGSTDLGGVPPAARATNLSMRARCVANASSTADGGSGHRTRAPRLSLARSLKHMHRRVVGTIAARVHSLHHPMAPSGPAVRLRGFALFCVHCFQLFYLPFAMAFVVSNTAAIDSAPVSLNERWIVRINISLELVYLLDILATFNTATLVHHHGGSRYVGARGDIAALYLRRQLTRDLLSALPLETVSTLVLRNARPLVTVNPTLYHIGSVFRLLRIVNLVQTARSPWIVAIAASLDQLSQRVCGQSSAIASEVCKLAMTLVVVAHYCACGWHAIELSTAASGRIDSPRGSFAALATEYLGDLRCVLSVMAGNQGDSDRLALDANLSRAAYAALLQVVGVLHFAYLVGSISAVLSTPSSHSSMRDYDDRKHALALKMAKLQLPQELQDRIHRYFDHMWSEYNATSEDISDFTRDLSRPLALEVGLCQYMDLVMRVPFWTDCSVDFVCAVVLTLHVRVFLPDDHVVRQGEIGTELFMINRGVSELTGGDRESTRLESGAAFGELALLLDCMRTTSVRALTYLEVCALQRGSFHAILARHYKDRRHVVTRILHHGLESKEHPQLWEEVLARKTHVKKKECGDSRRMFAGQETEEPRDKTSDAVTVSEAVEVLVNALNLDGDSGTQALMSPLTCTNGDLTKRDSESWTQSLNGRGLHTRAQPTPSQSATPRPCIGRHHGSLQGHQLGQGEQLSATIAASEGATSDTATEAERNGQAGTEHQAGESLQRNNALANLAAQNYPVELLQSLAAAMERVEDTLSNVEKRLQLIEDQKASVSPPTTREDSVDDALIAVTMQGEEEETGNLKPTAERSAHLERVCSRSHVLSNMDSSTSPAVFVKPTTLEQSRRTVSLNVDSKSILESFQRQRQFHRRASRGGAGNAAEWADVSAAARLKPHSPSFQLQHRRGSKTKLADQLWLKETGDA